MVRRTDLVCARFRLILDVVVLFGSGLVLGLFGCGLLVLQRLGFWSSCICGGIAWCCFGDTGGGDCDGEVGVLQEA